MPTLAETPMRKVQSVLSRTVTYFIACSVVTSGLCLVISQKPEPGPLVKLNFFNFLLRFLPGPHWIYPIGILLIAMPFAIQKMKLTSKHPAVSVVACVVVLLILPSSNLFSAHVYSSFWIQLWFLVVGLILRPLALTLLSPERRGSTDWTRLLFIPIATLFTFSRIVYPKVETSWGGGQPVPVVFYLSKDSPLRPGEPLPALLLDESDSGFYFVEEKETQAVFIPRSQVSMLFFSEKPLLSSPSRPSTSPVEQVPKPAEQQVKPATSEGPTAATPAPSAAGKENTKP
jgi:hypothetical protein